MFYWKDIPVTVLRNRRARRVWLKMRSCKGLEIVLPPDISSREVPAILARHERWIERQYAALSARGEGELILPEAIHFAFVARVCAVRYAHGPEARLTMRQEALFVTYAPDRKAQAAALLQRFLVREGNFHLVPFCLELADRCGIGIASVSVRNQKTLWGSCSARGGISLNARLMLLPPELARHVMLHEFCHVNYRNHGRGFQEELHRLDPMTSIHEEALRRAWDRLPGWTKYNP